MLEERAKKERKEKNRYAVDHVCALYSIRLTGFCNDSFLCFVCGEAKIFSSTLCVVLTGGGWFGLMLC